jgi:hypothetical protein
MAYELLHCQNRQPPHGTQSAALLHTRFALVKFISLATVHHKQFQADLWPQREGEQEPPPANSNEVTTCTKCSAANWTCHHRELLPNCHHLNPDCTYCPVTKPSRVQTEVTLIPSPVYLLQTTDNRREALCITLYMEEIEGKGYDQKTLYMQDIMTWPEYSVIWKKLVTTDNRRGSTDNRREVLCMEEIYA